VTSTAPRSSPTRRRRGDQDRALQRRRHLAAAIAFAAAGEYAPTPEGIRRARRDILALPAERIEHRVAGNRDFYATSTCRDLLFHVQAHAYDLGEIAGALAHLDLDFLGFELDNPEAVAAYRATNPDDATSSDLAAWRRFEDEHPETFAGMYQRWRQKR